MTTTAAPVRPGRGARLRTPLLVGAGAVALWVAVALRDPNRPGSWLTCPYLATTGYYCPGCGTLRALHALAHGDVLRAIDLNAALVLVAGPALVVVWLLTVRRAWLGVPRRWTPGPRLLLTIPVLVVIWTVARNLPGLSFLAP